MKKFGLMLLMVCMLAMVFSAAALASVKVGGVEISDGQYMNESGEIVAGEVSAGYAYYNGGVLTLHDFDLEFGYEGIYTDADLQINLVGSNSLTSTEEYSDAIATYDEYDVTISGSGSLDIKSEIGIYCCDLVIDGCELDIKSIAGIICSDLVIGGCELDIKSIKGIKCYDLVIDGCELSIDVSGDDAINADNVVIKGANARVYVKAVDSEYDDGAIFCRDSLTIESPLQIVTPAGGKAVADEYYATVQNADGTPAKEVLICAPSNVPATGDAADLALWIALIGFAAAGLFMARKRAEY